MSDVHANPAALEKALADARRHGCTRFLFLGDVTGYGYDVRRALELVRDNFDVVLMGNHDAVCLGLERSAMTELNPNYDLDRAHRKLLTEEESVWLRGRDYGFGEGAMACVHADFVRPQAWNYIFEESAAQSNFQASPHPLLFCGHSHHASVWELNAGRCRPTLERRLRRPALRPETISFVRRPDCRYIVNVGSVGYPRNDYCSVYVIYDVEKRRVSYRRLPFDFRGYIEEMMSRGVPLPTWLMELLRLAQR